MSRMIDIRSKITNQLPVIQITDEIVVTVNNRKSNILKVQAFVKEQEKQAKKNSNEFDEVKFMNDVLTMLIGEKNAKAIEDLDLPLPDYKTVYEEIMKAATGEQEQEGNRFQR